MIPEAAPVNNRSVKALACSATCRFRRRVLLKFRAFASFISTGERGAGRRRSTAGAPLGRMPCFIDIIVFEACPVDIQRGDVEAFCAKMSRSTRVEGRFKRPPVPGDPGMASMIFCACASDYSTGLMPMPLPGDFIFPGYLGR